MFRHASAEAIAPSEFSRAVNEVVWFWIGPHEQYETILYML